MAKNCRVPPSFPQMPRTTLPRGSVSHSAKDAEAPARRYTDRRLADVSPLREQFEPTEGSPIPQRQKMAGVE